VESVDLNRRAVREAVFQDRFALLGSLCDLVLPFSGRFVRIWAAEIITK